MLLTKNSSSFSGPIFCILSPRSEEKVVCIDARRGVTAVQNTEPDWYEAIFNFPSDAMRGLRSTMNAYAAIPLLIGGGNPKKAPSVGFGHRINLDAFGNGAVMSVS